MVPYWVVLSHELRTRIQSRTVGPNLVVLLGVLTPFPARPAARRCSLAHVSHNICLCRVASPRRPCLAAPLSCPFSPLRVNTANAAESSPTGEGWGWDGEDEEEEDGGNDIEMPLASSSKKAAAAQAASASASQHKFGLGGGGLGGGFRQQPAIPIAKPPGSSTRDSTSMLLSARQKQLGGKGGGGRRGKKKAPDGTGILAVDDDLFVCCIPRDFLRCVRRLGFCDAKRVHQCWNFGSHYTTHPSVSLVDPSRSSCPEGTPFVCFSLGPSCFVLACLVLLSARVLNPQQPDEAVPFFRPAELALSALPKTTRASQKKTTRARQKKTRREETKKHAFD